MTVDVTVIENGPLHCAGAMRVAGESKDEAYLCRCGLSSAKPFCDGSHNGPFTDAGRATPTDSAATTPDPGDTAFNLLKNGPILVSGPHRVVGSDGVAISAGTKGALCRCGASANKPFCDGAHKGCGFVAD